ncbi:MAG: RHS repeat protein [Clostridiales bacterium]|nr:RHS repeat protein [Clostridiales bacterium]
MRKQRFGFIIAIFAAILGRILVTLFLACMVLFHEVWHVYDIPFNVIGSSEKETDYDYYRHSNSRVLWDVGLGMFTGFGSESLNAEKEAAILAKYSDADYLTEAQAIEYDNNGNIARIYPQDETVYYIDYEYTDNQKAKAAGYAEDGSLRFEKLYNENGILVLESVYWEYGLDYTREYDAVSGLPLCETMGYRENKKEWEYDEHGRLIRETSADTTIEYAYDAFGNAISCKRTQYYTDEREPASYTHGWFCAYDENHNRTRFLAFNQDDGVVYQLQYTYDWETNRVTESAIYKRDFYYEFEYQWYSFFRGWR